jgi:uncharacterized coiled-coil DUF342 family protein
MRDFMIESEAYQKIEKCNSEITDLSNKLERTIKNVKRCRETCQSTSAMIGELNDIFKKF